MSVPATPAGAGWRPALPPQRALWLASVLDSRTPDNFVPFALQYEGSVPGHLLRQALGEVVRRHAVLRWQFRTTREGLQFVERPWSPPAVALVEASGPGARDDWRRIVRGFISRPFDIAAYPLFRFLHVRFGGRQGLVVGVFHHALADGWSMAVLGAELEALWPDLRRGAAPALADLDVRYADLWGPDGSARNAGRGLAYWQDALRGLDRAGCWPWPRRKASGASRRILRRSDRLEAGSAAALRREAAKLRTTPFLFLASVFAVLRWRLEGRAFTVVGTDAAGRTDARAERLIGFFINVLPLGIRTDPRARFADHLDGVRRQFLAAYEHQGTDYEAIVRSIAPPRRAGRNPLFNVKLMMHNFLDHQLHVPGVAVAPAPIELHGSSEDLKLFVRPAGGSFALDWEGRADCFSEGDLDDVAASFRHLLTQAVASPWIALRDLTLRAPDPPAMPEMPARRTSFGAGRPAVPPAAPRIPADAASEAPRGWCAESGPLEQRRGQLEATSEAPGACAGGTIGAWTASHEDDRLRAASHEVDRLWAAIRGGDLDLDDRELVRTPDGRTTVREFSRRVGELAAGLRAFGARPGTIVGLHLPPSLDFLLCACATLTEGAGFVVVDPGEPARDAAAFFRAAHASLIIVARSASDLALDPGVRVVPVADVRLRAARTEARSRAPHPDPLAPHAGARSHAARPGDVALVEVCEATPAGPDRHHLDTWQFTHATFAARLAAWSAVWRSEPGAYVANLDPGDALSLVADLAVCVEQRRTLLAGGVDPAAARGTCCYLRVPAASLSRTGALPIGGLGVANVVVEGRVTPGACARVRRANRPARLHVFPRLPGVALVAGHVAWRDAFDDLCRMPAGSPLGGTSLHLLDAWLHPLPATGIGEIYAGGDIASALGDAGRTAERLVPSPFGDGGRLLRTGIRGVRLAGGGIVMLGPRRVLRPSPDRACDVLVAESILLEHPAVDDALVLQTGEPEAPRVAAIVTPAGGGVHEAESWTALLARLGRAGLPDSLHVAAALPLDRRGRVVPGLAAFLRDERPAEQTARTPVGEEVATIWREVLSLDREVGPHEDFFALGGDSIAATRLAFRIEERFEIELPVAEVFAHRTPERLAERVHAAVGASAPAARLERIDSGGLVPVASAQQRLLFLHTLDASDAAYNCPAALELRGRPSLPLVAQCVDGITRRHDVLRTVFLAVAGEFRQLVLPHPGVPLLRVDLTGIGTAAALAGRLRRAALRRPFALQEAPAWRATIAAVDPGVCQLALTLHHVISDAWSERILLHEFSALAERFAAGRPPALAPLPFQYRDYAAWQAKRLQGGHLARLMDGWASLTAAADLEPIVLGGRAAARGSRRVGYERFAVPPALLRRLVAAGRTRGATLYMLVLAAFQSLLHRVTGRESITILGSAANRYPREMQDVVGFFAHNFPVASRWDAGDTVLTLLPRTRDYLVEALRLQELPFDRIVDAVRRARPDADPAATNVSFLMLPAAAGVLPLPGARVRPLQDDDVDPRFDLEMQMSLEDDRMAGTLEYATAYVTAERAAALVAEYLDLLEAAAAPERVANWPRPTAGLRRAVPLAGGARPVALACAGARPPAAGFPAPSSIAPDPAPERQPDSAPAAAGRPSPPRALARDPYHAPFPPVTP